jgi:hypothetical protein
MSDESRTTTDGQTVRLSVPVDRRTHARLCGLAALEGKHRAVVAAAILRKGLVKIVVQDPTKGATTADLDGGT